MGKVIVPSMKLKEIIDLASGKMPEIGFPAGKATDDYVMDLPVGSTPAVSMACSMLPTGRVTCG